MATESFQNGGSPIAFQFAVVRAALPGGGMTLAQADTLAHASGLIGVCYSSSVASGLNGTIVPINAPAWVQFTATPTLGNTAYLSTATAGQAQDTAPAATGTNQIIPLGTITRVSGTLGKIEPGPGALAAMIAAIPSPVPLAGHAAQSIVGNPTSGTASATDIAIGTDSVAGRAGSGNVGSVSMTAAGRAMAGAASATAQTALLDLAAIGAKGLGPARSGAAGSYLDVTGAYSVPAGTSAGTITALVGDVLASGTGSVSSTIAHVPFTPLQTALAAASAALDFNGQQLTGVADPTTSQGAATKAYVDAAIAGFGWKQPVLCASTTNVSLSTGAHSGSVIDDIALTTGARFALLIQTTPSENGVYTANASGAPTRATDADTGAELVSCAFFVEEGTVNADKAFVCTNDAITLGTTSVNFVPFASVVGALIAKNNLSDLTNPATARTNLGLVAIASSGSATDLISGTVSTARLPASGATAGTYGDAAHVSTVTVDVLGRITSAVQTAISISASAVTGLAAVATSGSASDLGTGTLPAARLPASGVTAGTYGDASHSAVVTFDAAGRATGASQTPISIAAGSVSGLSPIATAGLPQFTGGSVTSPSAGSVRLDLVTIPDATPVPGRLRGSATAPGANPPTGKGDLWYDATDKIWKNLDDVGLATHMVRAQPAFVHNFVTEIRADGTVSIAQPSFADLSGNIIASQLPVPGNSIIGNNTGSTAPAAALSVSDVRAMLDLWDGPFLHSFVGTFGHNPMWITNDNLSYTVPRGWTLRAGASKIFVRVNLFDTSFGGRNISVTLEQRSGHAGSPTTLLTMGPYGGTVEDSSTASVTLGAGDEIDVKLGGSFSAGVDSGAMFVGVWFQ